MAAIENTRTLATAKPFGGLTTTFFGAFAAWNDARVTRKALTQLSDRELNDIGLSRGSIEDVIAHRF